MPVKVAIPEEIPFLVELINSAYRGEASRAGWTTEADFVGGDLRTDAELMTDLMNRPGAVYLNYINENREIEGTVFLHIKEPGKLYLGMLSVNPLLQAKGIGKKLMGGAEEYARQNSCSMIYMRVISRRHELIAWYEKQGYYRTGETQPFLSDKYGIAKEPIEFVVLQKDI